MCDCGWSFVDQTMTEPRHRSGDRDEEDDRGSPGSAQITVGVVALALGLGLTAVTYGLAAASPSGGVYILVYGPMIFGVGSIIRGVAKKHR